MACFIAPLALAIITAFTSRFNKGICEKFKLYILNAILLGGSILLIVEHVWHGEITPYPPFLTAMHNPEDLATAIREIETVGISMVFASVGVWGGIIGFEKTIRGVLMSRSSKSISKAVSQTV